MISLKEALSKCDDIKLLKEIEKIYEGQGKKKVNFKTKNGEFLSLSHSTISSFMYVEQLRKRVPFSEGKKRNFFFNCLYEDWNGPDEISSYFDTTSIEEKDLENLRINVELPTSFEEKPLDELKKINERLCQVTEQVTMYSYIYEDVGKILSYYLPQSAIDKYGLETNLAHIIYELTWFGFSENEIDEAKDEFKEDLMTTIEEIEKMNLDEFPKETEKVSSGQKEILERRILVNSIMFEKKRIETLQLLLDELRQKN